MIYDSLGIEDDMELQVKSLTKVIDSSQKKLEAMHFSARKNVLEYDDVNNVQRTITYEQRRQVIFGEDVHGLYLQMIDRVASRICNQFALDGVITTTERYSLGKLLEEIFGQLPSVLLVQDVSKDIPQCDELAANIAEEAKARISEKENEVSSEIFREVGVR